VPQYAGTNSTREGLGGYPVYEVGGSIDRGYTLERCQANDFEGL